MMETRLVGVEGLTATASAWIADDEREWWLTRQRALLIAAIPIALAIAGILAVPFKSAYRVLANEDGIAEWLQVLALVVLFVIYLRLAVRLWRSGHRVYAVLFVVAAGGVFFIAGEEISWGQRIFGVATPEELEEINNQGETNIHNIGPLLRIFNIVVLVVSAGACVMPLLRWTVWRDRARGLAGYLFIPPLALIPAFGFAFAYRAIRLVFLPEPRYVISRYAEIAELSFYFGLVVFAWLTLRALTRRGTLEPVRT
ncbi:MAG: hypothetical protein ACJ77Y_13465 [Chloroflexota bacterium]